MIAILGIAMMIIAVVIIIIRVSRRPSVQDDLHTVVETCTRCGCTRTSLVTDPAFAGHPIIGHSEVRKVTYNYPPTYTDDTSLVCRSVGHAWPQR